MLYQDYQTPTPVVIVDTDGQRVGFSSSGSGGSGSSATEGQILNAVGGQPVDNILPDVRSLLKSLLNKSDRPSLTPTLELAATNGTIPIGAKYVAIAIKTGSGTILGMPVDTNFDSIEFPLNLGGYGAIAYTVDPGSEFIIQTAR